MRDERNIIPVTMAVLLHALLLASVVFAFDWSKSARPPTPLAVTASLVSANELTQAPRPEPEPEPALVEPEPEPEPEPPPVDEEAERRALEEQKRLEEQRAEQERVRQQQLREEQERIRREQEQERQRREEAERERQRREEAERERQRELAEQKRLEELERQRVENERKRREAEEAERQRRLQAELDAEEARLEAMRSGELARYIFAIQQKIQRNWIQPPSAHPGIECVVNVRQLPGGEVVSVQFASCNGDDAVRRSIEAAIFKASPLPEPANPALFERNLRITVKPEQ